MADDFVNQVSKLWKGFRKKATDTLARQQASYVLGRVVGTPVLDDAGVLIVDAGHRVDEGILARAEASGKLNALVAAVLTAQKQDLQEKAGELLQKMPDQQEAKTLDSVEEYAETRRYIGRVAGVDVTTIRGDVVIAAGKEITEQDVRLAREHDLLSALRYAALQTPPEAAIKRRVETPPGPTRLATPETPVRPRPSLPLMTPDKEE